MCDQNFKVNEAELVKYKPVGQGGVAGQGPVDDCTAFPFLADYTLWSLFGAAM